jgi:DNA-binding response OmpR family regulator
MTCLWGRGDTGWGVGGDRRRTPNRHCAGADTIAGMTASAHGATVLVYSNSADVRAQVRTAVGRRPAPDTGRVEWVECATNAEVVGQLDEGGLDLVIVDGEAQPTGGMGLARQFKYEIDDCPPIVVLIARPQDAWLASWSLADAVIHMPLDPIEAAEVVAEQIRRRARGIPVVR